MRRALLDSCGSLFHDDCYWRAIAPASEQALREALWAGSNDEGALYLLVRFLNMTERQAVDRVAALGDVHGHPMFVPAGFGGGGDAVESGAEERAEPAPTPATPGGRKV